MFTDELKDAIDKYQTFPTRRYHFEDLTPILRKLDLLNKLIKDISKESFFQRFRMCIRNRCKKIYKFYYPNIITI